METGPKERAQLKNYWKKCVLHDTLVTLLQYMKHKGCILIL